MRKAKSNDAATKASTTKTSSSKKMMSKAEAELLSNDELLDMVKKSQGHTGSDFQAYMNCDFSYTTLTGILKDRGFVNGWHLPSSDVADVVRLKRYANKPIRQAFLIDEQVADDWKALCHALPYRSVLLSIALERFMSDLRNKRITIELDV